MRSLFGLSRRALVIATGALAVAPTSQGSFHHPASGQVGNIDPAVEFAFETSADEIRAKIIATVRQVIVEELTSKGQDVPADRIAVTLV